MPTSLRDKMTAIYKSKADSYEIFYYSGFDQFILIFSLAVITAAWANAINIMNFVYTNSRIRPDDIPCWSSDLYLGLGSYWYDQYFFEWWINVAYLVTVFYPGYEIYLWSSSSTQGTQTRIENLFISAAVFIVFSVIFGVQAYESFFCADFNFCRSCPCTQKFNCEPNSAWWFRLMFTLFFLIVCLVYGTLALLGYFEDESKTRVKRWAIKGESLLYLQSRGYDITA